MKQRRHTRNLKTKRGRVVRTINPWNIKPRAKIYVGIRGVRRSPPGSVIRPRAKIYVRPKRKPAYGSSGFVNIPGWGNAEVYDAELASKKEEKAQGKFYDDFVKQNVKSAKSAVLAGDFDKAADDWGDIAGAAKKRAQQAADNKDEAKKKLNDFVERYNALAKRSNLWAPDVKQKAEDDYKLMEKFVRRMDELNDMEKKNYELAVKKKELATKAALESDLTTSAQQQAELLRQIEDFKKAEEARRKAYVESRSLFKKMNFNFPKTFAKIKIGGFRW